MSTQSRRSFLKTAGLAAGAVVMPLTTFAARRAERKPNILVIMSDEHNAGVMGCYDNDVAETANLDGLSRRGITFESCYCNSPLCVPSRLSFTSGKYVSRVGAWNNSCWLESDDYPSLPRIMNAAGYDSVLCGKMHYDRTRRYGFREIGGNMNNANKTGKGSRRKADNIKATGGISSRFDDFHAGDKSGILDHDREVTSATVQFLADRKASDKPFFLLAGYLAPHFPLIVPQKYWDRFKGKVPMPRIPKGHLESQPRNYKHHRIAFKTEGVPDEIVRQGRELYYGLTQWLDDEIGKILWSLADSEVAENTVVIYTTDHGENMGEHGLWWKNVLYEHASRVPLIVSWPARWVGGQRRTQACSLVDVVQTIAEIGAADIPTDWDGDSMLRLLDDPRTMWKDLAVSEYYGHNVASGSAMIRMGRYKYIYHNRADADHPAERELYDMLTDPGEFDNLADQRRHSRQIRQMHEVLVKEIGEDPEITERRCRSDCAKGYSRGEKNKKKQQKA